MRFCAGGNGYNLVKYYNWCFKSYTGKIYSKITTEKITIATWRTSDSYNKFTVVIARIRWLIITFCEKKKNPITL